MFVESEFSWSIAVQPGMLRSTSLVQKTLIQSLLTRFDDTKWTAEHGYFVAVTRIEDIGEGTVKEGKGYVTYLVSFRGLTFKPIKGEIALVTVVQVTKDHILANIGPGQIWIPNSEESGLKGVYKFQEEKWTCEHTDGSVISDGTTIRVAIKETSWFKNVMFTIGSLKGEYLGVVRQSSQAFGEASGQKGKQCS